LLGWGVFFSAILAGVFTTMAAYTYTRLFGTLACIFTGLTGVFSFPLCHRYLPAPFRERTEEIAVAIVRCVNYFLWNGYQADYI